jgi:hypothetical protein
MNLLANITAVWLFLAGVGLLAFILMRRSYRYFGKPSRRRNESALDLQPRPKGPWDGAQHDAMARIDREKVEMFEMARDLNGQLSSRIIVLEKLIADSQRQIKRMEELVAQLDHAHDDATKTSSFK